MTPFQICLAIPKISCFLSQLFKLFTKDFFAFFYTLLYRLLGGQPSVIYKHHTSLLYVLPCFEVLHSLYHFITSKLSCPATHFVQPNLVYSLVILLLSFPVFISYNLYCLHFHLPEILQFPCLPFQYILTFYSLYVFGSISVIKVVECTLHLQLLLCP